MSDIVGAWERKAKICLVDVIQDNEVFSNLLNHLEQENQLNPQVFKQTSRGIELARIHLSSGSDVKFICMLVWAHENQQYLPFTSDIFENDDVELLQNIVKEFIEISIQCCSDGFEVTTFSDTNKLLAYAIQATCENEMMAINLKRYESKD